MQIYSELQKLCLHPTNAQSHIIGPSCSHSLVHIASVIIKLTLWFWVLLQANPNQIKWEQIDIWCRKVLNNHVHAKLTMENIMKLALSIMAVFSKQCTKLFVEGFPRILSFIAGHYQMNLASLIANWYAYWDIFAEVGYVRNRGFNVLCSGGHGGINGAGTILFYFIYSTFQSYAESHFFACAHQHQLLGSGEFIACHSLPCHALSLVISKQESPSFILNLGSLLRRSAIFLVFANPSSTKHFNTNQLLVHHTIHMPELSLVLPWLGLGIFNKMDITQGGLL